MPNFERICERGGVHIKKIAFFPFPTPKKVALRLLQWQLPIIMLWALAILLTLLRDYPSDPLGASHTFMDCVEYILASLVLSCISAVFADLIEREREKR